MTSTMTFPSEIAADPFRLQVHLLARELSAWEQRRRELLAEEVANAKAIQVFGGKIIDFLEARGGSANTTDIRLHIQRSDKATRMYLRQMLKKQDIVLVSTYHATEPAVWAINRRKRK